MRRGVTSSVRSGSILFTHSSGWAKLRSVIPIIVTLAPAESGGAATCTADSTLGRFFCVDVFSLDGFDAFDVELWVFDLNSPAATQGCSDC